MYVKDFLHDKFSWSKLQCFATCPRLFYYRYVLKRRDPPSLAILFGRGCHEGMEVDAYAKLRGEKLSIQQVLDAAVAGFEEERAKEDTKDASTDDFVKQHRRQLEVFEESGERAKIVPVPGTVEATFQLEVEVGAEGAKSPALIEGYCDVVTEGEQGRAVVNWKSAARPMSLHEAESHLQLGLEIMGTGAERGRVVSFVKAGKQRPTTKVVEAALGEARRAKLFRFVGETIMAIRAALKTGDFPKCSPNAFWCSAQSCSMYDMCYGKEHADRFVNVTKIHPAGSLPAQSWRESRAGRAERLKKETTVDASNGQVSQ